MERLEKIKQSMRCCISINSEGNTDKNCVSVGCPRFPDEETNCVNALLADALECIEMLEGVIKADPQYFTYEMLTVVRDVCEGYLHCSDCPLSDADGDCPFIKKTGERLMPCEWELWRMGGNEPQNHIP